VSIVRVCRFPGESCELRAVGYIVTRDGRRIPVCAPHLEKTKAHLIAMKAGVTMPNGPMNPRVREARAMLNAHTTPCATCRPVVDELARRMAAMTEAPTPEQTVAIGEFIEAHACKIGRRLYAALGRAMLAIREPVES
jgi:hypothetical protein